MDQPFFLPGGVNLGMGVTSNDVIHSFALAWWGFGMSVVDPCYHYSISVTGLHWVFGLCELLRFYFNIWIRFGLALSDYL